MTYGALKFRVTQMFPGVSLDLIEGFIADRYSEILDELSWSRLTVSAQLLTTAPYATGTVAITAGSNAVTLTGGTWTTLMSGRAFRPTGRSEFYEFTYVSATTATLDRVYEGTTASAAGYSIFQFIYALPTDCGLLTNEAFATAYGELKRFDHAQLNQSDPSRLQTGTPTAWSSYMDDSSTPPRMQVELWPIPSTAIGIPFTYIADTAALTATSTILQVWMDPTALLSGVEARILRHLKDYPGSQLAQAQADKALRGMRATEARGIGPAQMKMDSSYISHRMKRWNR